MYVHTSCTAKPFLESVYGTHRHAVDDCQLPPDSFKAQLNTIPRLM